jgi:hypothetical protein
MSSGYTIHVAGLASETTEEKLHDFFSCKYTNIREVGGGQSADAIDSLRQAFVG